MFPSHNMCGDKLPVPRGQRLPQILRRVTTDPHASNSRQFAMLGSTPLQAICGGLNGRKTVIPSRLNSHRRRHAVACGQRAVMFGHSRRHEVVPALTLCQVRLDLRHVGHHIVMPHDRGVLHATADLRGCRCDAHSSALKCASRAAHTCTDARTPLVEVSLVPLRAFLRGIASSRCARARTGSCPQ